MKAQKKFEITKWLLFFGFFWITLFFFFFGLILETWQYSIEISFWKKEREKNVETTFLKNFFFTLFVINQKKKYFNHVIILFDQKQLESAMTSSSLIIIVQTWKIFYFFFFFSLTKNKIVYCWYSLRIQRKITKFKMLEEKKNCFILSDF